jgi:hypothetical protein
MFPGQVKMKCVDLRPMLASASDLLASQKDFVEVLRQDDWIITEIFKPTHLRGRHRSKPLRNVSNADRHFRALETRTLEIALKWDRHRFSISV